MNGHFVYKHKYAVSQNENVLEYFDEFIKNENFDLILEIGTQMGGFTAIIDDLLEKHGKNTPIITYDITHYSYVQEDFNERGIIYIKGDAFSEDITNEIISYIIQPETRILLFCDGGYKSKEVNLYSPHLKSGDVVMCHDYAPSFEYWEKNMKGTIWDWCEVTYPDIKETLEKHNFIPYEKDNFLNVAWGCFIKQ